MSNRLSGKRVLITAAGQGIGRATAIAMAREGACVFATDVNSESLQYLASELPGESETFLLDARDDVSVVSGVERAQPDILFNCAGVVHSGSVLEARDEEWDLAFDLNVRSMFRTIRAALPRMLEKGRGSIINMSSACSSIIGAPNRFIYGTTKAAVIGLTKSIANEYISHGIRCNAICPGTVDTPSLQYRLHATGDYHSAMREFVARQPMGRIADASEIAYLAVYLACEESAFMTGQAHVIDGGWSM